MLIIILMVIAKASQLEVIQRIATIIIIKASQLASKQRVSTTSASMMAEKKANIHLFDLPQEVRDLIYHFVKGDENDEKLLTHRRQTRPLMRVCHSIRSEYYDCQLRSFKKAHVKISLECAKCVKPGFGQSNYVKDGFPYLEKEWLDGLGRGLPIKHLTFCISGSDLEWVAYVRADYEDGMWEVQWEMIDYNRINPSLRVMVATRKGKARVKEAAAALKGRLEKMAKEADGEHPAQVDIDYLVEIMSKSLRRGCLLVRPYQATDSDLLDWD